MTSFRSERVNGFKCGGTWKGAGRGTADSKCRNYKSLVQDFTQLSRNLLEFRPRRVTLTIGWYGVKDVMMLGNYGKVLHFSTKEYRAERLGDEKESTAREDSHGVLC